MPLAKGAFDMLGANEKVPADGRARAVAFTIGKGRVVLFGEGALFTAQVASSPGCPTGDTVLPGQTTTIGNGLRMLCIG